MYKVIFLCNEDAYKSTEDCAIFFSDKDVEAIQFALSLHQASNLPHEIKVLKSTDPIITGADEIEVCLLYKSK